jgi:hypothetical protein
MIIRKVDSENDWRFGKGKADYARDEQAIEQNINGRLLSWVGDCFWALNDGVDWKSRLDIGQEEALSEECKNIILSSEGVVGITSVVVSLGRDSRMISIAYDVDTIYSQSFRRTIEQGAGV